MGYTSNIDAIILRMEKIPETIDRKVMEVVRRAVMAIDKGVHEKTPVWSGLAIRNMIWTMGRPNTTEYPEIKIGNVEGEGRRSANAQAARSTLAALTFKKPYGVWYLSNASKHIFDLEAGKLPDPKRNRVPKGGMFGLTYSDVKNNLGRMT